MTSLADWARLEAAGACVNSADSALRPGHRAGGPNPMSRLERAIDRLDLDAETRDEVEVLLVDARSAGEEFGEQHRDARDGLRDILADNDADPAEALAQVEAIGELETARHKHGVTLLFEIRELLTADQIEALQDAMRPRRDRRFGDRRAR